MARSTLLLTAMTMFSSSRRRWLACAVALTALSSFALPAWADGFTSNRITVKVEGQGSDVVLIPGLGSSPKVWEQLVKAVPGYRYHLVQVSGFAGQPAGANAQGPVAGPVADEIARYIKEAGLNKPAVIGHSLGGTMGMMIAARHPEATSRLMVVDMLPFLGLVFGPPGSTPESLKPMAEGLEAGIRNAAPEARKARTEQTIAGMVNTASMRPVALADSMNSDPNVVGPAYREVILTDLRPELGRITVPVTVVYARPNNPAMPAERFDAMYKWSYADLKGVSMKGIDGTAHFIMWDQPAVFANEVRSFLGAK